MAWSYTVDSQGRYRNPLPTQHFDLYRLPAVVSDYRAAELFPSGEVPVEFLDAQTLHKAPDNSLYRLGHSTLLIKLNGRMWLTDPVFCERASFSQLLGPKRFHPSPLSIDDMPPLAGVIISHDHYDHLDRQSIIKLAEKTDYFLMPLKVGDRLRRWGVPEHKLVELDWWESHSVHGINLTATPAHHFSGRGLMDGNRTLWCSWCIESTDCKLFFSGDSGYFPGFREIGDRHGPFDITLMETGAYGEAWSDIHMFPEQSLEAHIDVGGRQLLPIHNGTFQLSTHHWYEPLERIYNLCANKDVPLLTPRFGERVDILQPEKTTSWWRECMTAQVECLDARPYGVS